MTDYISRADAIEALGEEPEIWVDTEEEWAYHNAWVEHISALKALPSAEADWIPCSERLPDVGVEVLITTDWSEILIAWFIKGGAWETEYFILKHDETLAWMPLPKPYREDGEK